MFKYAVSNWIYGEEELETTCKRLHRFGYDAIELVGEPERYNLDQIKRLTLKYNLEVSSVLSWCLWPLEDRDLAHPNHEYRAQAVNYIMRNVDLAVEVGAPIVIIIPAPSGRPAPHRNPTVAADWQNAAKEEWELAVISVREVASYAQKNNISISVEPINRFETFLINSVDQGLNFVEDVGFRNVKLHLDTFHMNIEDVNLGQAIVKAGSLLTSMHLSDSNRCAIGRGHIDFKQIMKSLAEINFQGSLILEPLPLHPNPFIAADLEEFRSTWDSDLESSIGVLRELESCCS